MLQVVTGERNSLLAEVQRLSSRLQDAACASNSPQMCSKVAWQKRAKLVIHGLQVAMLLAYFIWEDYVRNTQCR